MSSEEKYILPMEAAYITADKNTTYKLMQEADQVLKDTQASVDSFDAGLLKDRYDRPQNS